MNRDQVRVLLIVAFAPLDIPGADPINWPKPIGVLQDASSREAYQPAKAKDVNGRSGPSGATNEADPAGLVSCEWVARLRGESCGRG